MSEIWPYFTKENPCPNCGHYYPDWTCRMGDKKYICMRAPFSQHPSKDGGFYHDYGEKKPVVVNVPKKRIQDKVPDFKKLMERYSRNYEPLDSLIYHLGVNSDSAVWLEVAWANDNSAWAIPMYNGEGEIIGIQLRYDDGSKKSITGSRLGLFIPQCEPQKIAYLPEGMSNTAALLTMGYFAIGRPSCNVGGDMLKACLKRLNINQVVIVADADEIKAHGKRPGYEGAIKLKKELGLKSCIITVPNPLKDVRQLLQKVGVDTARQMIQNLVNQQVWTK